VSATRGSESTGQRDMVWRITQYGIDLCRRGQWQNGLAQLAVIEASKGNDLAIQGLALTYYGYGIASQQGKMTDGLRYCRAGVDKEPWQAENHFNLARTYLLGGNVKRAVAALDYGLGIDPAHSLMIDLRLKLGVRRPPTFSFLPRGHALNRIAGRLRHRLASASARPARSVSETNRTQG
jgi:hypothetical protein